MNRFVALFIACYLSSICRGFDIQQYSKDHTNHDSVGDVNAIKKLILDLNNSKFSTPKTSESSLGNLLQCPLSKIRLEVYLYADCTFTGLSETIRFVIEETCRRRISETFMKYGIETVIESDISTPTLSVGITLVSTSVADGYPYLIETKLEVTRILIDPLTDLRVLSTVWSESSVKVLEKGPVGLDILSLACIDLQVCVRSKFLTILLGSTSRLHYFRLD